MNAESSVVFVIDDDEGVRKALSRLLQAAGFGVYSYASALEFLKMHDRIASGLPAARSGNAGIKRA